MRLSLAAASILLAACATGGGLERRGSGDGGAIDGGGIDAGASGSDTGTAIDAAGDAHAGDPCAPGDARFCTSGCGTMGTSSCEASGFFGACTPPPEDCNGADDDCDGRTDETIAPRACSSACGGGSETCTSGHWMGCTATTPGVESCNAMDDDCDGMADEMLSRTCTNACGASGTETCASGAYVGCTAPTVPAETCNATDDDCDGRIDESLQVAVYDGVVTGQVTAYQAACTGPGGSLDVCLTASKRWCVNRGCAIGGAGMLEGASGVVRVACVGSHATELNVSFAMVASDLGVAFDESMAGMRVASSYSNRWCTRQGYAAGIGPVEHAAGVMAVQCLAADQASVERVTTLEMILAASCDPTVYPDEFDCNIAADMVCRAHGFRAGWGPVEWNDMETYLVCFH